MRILLKFLEYYIGRFRGKSENAVLAIYETVKGINFCFKFFKMGSKDSLWSC